MPAIVNQLYNHFTLKWTYWLYPAVIALIIFFHLWHLGSIPKGLYVDESGIGYNALLITRTGIDEHGEKWPVYFKSFGDFKSPLVVYADAIAIALFGPSDFSVRFTGFAFHLLLLLAVHLIAAELFPRRNSIKIYALIATAFLPWIFTVSRLGFEVVTQPALVAFSLWLLLKTERAVPLNKALMYSLLAGIAVGLSLYTYSTARLLTPLMAASWLVLYAFKLPRQRIITFLSSLLIVSLPHIYYYLTRPENLTARFHLLTYLHNPTLSLPEKISIFFSKYTSYFGPKFLIFHAIEPRLHMTNYGGEILLAVFFLASFGIVALLTKKQFIKQRFILFLFINLLFAPVAASLTGPIGEAPHGFRSILLGLYLIIFSFYGLSFLLDLKDVSARRALTATVTIILIAQVALFLHHYFFVYPKSTIAEFQSYNFPQALQLAIAQKPKKIIVSSAANQPYMHTNFYREMIGYNATNLPLSLEPPIPKSDTCLIYFAWNDQVVAQSKLPYKELTPADNFTKVRCY